MPHAVGQSDGSAFLSGSERDLCCTQRVTDPLNKAAQGSSWLRGAAMMRPGSFGVFVWLAALPANAASDITLSGNAALLTQYVDRGITNSAERPAAQAEFDVYYKEIYYAGIWGSNVDFGAAPNGQELASLELDYYAGVAPTVGKWSFDIAAAYVAYPV